MRPSPSISVPEAPILMTATSLLIETSFSDAIEIIGKADEVPEQTRRHWMTSLRQIAKSPFQNLLKGYKAFAA